MSRDRVLKSAFEIADDGMQAAVGYFYFVAACHHVANSQIVVDYLPRGISGGQPPIIHYVMPMFHEWHRHYDPHELVDVMGEVFISYHIRTCTLAIVSTFEACLTNFIDRLVAKKMIPTVQDSYKQRLKWAFPILLSSSYGNQSMKGRLPQLCLDIDHARRVRNLWMHNNGNFTRRYKGDVIEVPGQKSIVVPEYRKFGRSPKSKVSFPISLQFFEQVSRSHIEALHHLHDMLQIKHFGQKRSYGYKAAQKSIEWARLLKGV